MLPVLPLLASLAAPSPPCEQLEVVYEAAEGIVLDGSDATEQVPELFAHAHECAEHGGERNALEAYFLGLSILRLEDSPLPSSACEPVVEASRLAEYLIEENSKNLRLQELQLKLDSIAASIECISDEPIPLPEIVEKPPPADITRRHNTPLHFAARPTRDLSTVPPRLKHATISMGVITGVALATTVTLYFATGKKARSIERELTLQEQQPELNSNGNICPLGGGPTTYCEELNRLKVGTFAALAVFVLAANTTLNLGLVYRAQKKRAAFRQERFKPKVEVGRGSAALGFSLKF